VFAEVAYPFGEPYVCAFSNEVVFSNTGDTHNIQMGCLDEAELQIDLGLPSGSYTINVAWGTSDDPYEHTNCSHTLFDDYYGTSCDLSTRIIAINDTVEYEIHGDLGLYSTTTVLSYAGAIDSLTLGVGTSGTESDYNTWYDYVEITSP
jgi:hypothetical protein